VRTSMNLKGAHSVIQAAMGWLDYHLWEFEAGERKYGMPIPKDPDWNERIEDAAKTTLSAPLTIRVREIGYV
jgi:hypothetical protein